MKKHIIETLKGTGLTEAQANEQLDTVVAAITSVVRQHGEANLPGFGKFKAKLRASRTVRNPKTGDMIQTAERTALTFKPSSTFTL